MWLPLLNLMDQPCWSLLWFIIFIDSWHHQLLPFWGTLHSTLVTMRFSLQGGGFQVISSLDPLSPLSEGHPMQILDFWKALFFFILKKCFENFIQSYSPITSHPNSNKIPIRFVTPPTFYHCFYNTLTSVYSAHLLLGWGLWGTTASKIADSLSSRTHQLSLVPHFSVQGLRGLFPLHDKDWMTSACTGNCFAGSLWI